jgi:hypothetical protein
LGGAKQRSGVSAGRSGDAPQDARPRNGPTGWEERGSQHGRRNRTILANAMDCAMELGLPEMNPIRRIKWTMPKVSSQVDRRSVVNPRQARALLEAVRAQQPS